MRLALIFSLGLLAVQAHAAFDVFLQVLPSDSSFIIGGVTDPVYSGWVKVLGFESGTERVANPEKGGGVFTEFIPFVLVKAVDETTPVFFEKLTARTAIDRVKMVVVKRTPLRVEAWDITAEHCRFTGQSFQAKDGGEDIVERLSFSVMRFEYSYIQLAPSGDPLTEIFAYWNNGTAPGTGAYGTRVPDFLGGVVTGGIPNGWRAWYFGHTDAQAGDKSLSTDDPDGDGHDNLHEYIAHTDPRVPQSVLRVTAFQPGAPGSYLLTWQSVAGLTYRIFTAPAPGGPFTFLKTVVSAGDGTTSTTVAGPAGQFFYRVVTP